MCEARQRDQWEHTSALIAWTVNCHQGGKGRARQPSEFNPFKQRAARIEVPQKDQFAIMRQIFCPAAKPPS